MRDASQSTGDTSKPWSGCCSRFELHTSITAPEVRGGGGAPERGRCSRAAMLVPAYSSAGHGSTSVLNLLIHLNS